MVSLTFGNVQIGDIIQIGNIIILGLKDEVGHSLMNEEKEGKWSDKLPGICCQKKN